MRASAGSAIPRSAMKLAASSARKLGQLGLDARGQRDNGRRRAPGGLDESERFGAETELRRVGLAGVDRDEQRLVREKGVAAEHALLFGAELRVAQRNLALEGRHDAAEDLGFLNVLGAVGLPRQAIDLLQALLGDRVVGEDELGLHRRHVARRVDRSFGVRQRVVVERADDVGQGVGRAQLGQRQDLRRPPPSRAPGGRGTRSSPGSSSSAGTSRTGARGAGRAPWIRRSAPLHDRRGSARRR